MKEVRIKVYPRIHITLIGMNQNGYRKHGGIGFSISEPTLDIVGRSHNKFEINDNRNFKLEDLEYLRLKNALEKLSSKYNLLDKINITINGEIKPHHGFGSETSLRLACIEILAKVNNKNIIREELIDISGRGGVSGIGINTYFEGGFICDTGIGEVNSEYKPSNLMETRTSLPLKLKRVEMENWEVGLFLSDSLKALREEEELTFFQKSCPISDHETYEILYECIYGCLSAMIEKNKLSFCNSINKIQKTKWKTLERSLYDGLVEENERVLFSAGASAVGMSSLGPLQYFFSNIPINDVINKAEAHGLVGKFYSSKLNNRGRIVFDE